MTHTKELDPMERIAIALERNTIALERIADLLEQQPLQGNAPNFSDQPVPIENLVLNLSANIEEFKGFNWVKIGAKVVQVDQYGVSIVSYGGRQYKRRSPDNACTPAI